MRNKRGIARKGFRMDAGRPWKPKARIDSKNKPESAEARQRMIEEQAEDAEREKNAPVHFADAVAEQQKKGITPQSLTDEVVNDYMGGKYAAAEQAAAYRDFFENVKAGRTTDPKGSLAEAARQRMIDRDEEGHPDSGKDKANRRAYPVNG